ncbi:MAG: spermidine synthase [Burkholderiales bacterium]
MRRFLPFCLALLACAGCATGSAPVPAESARTPVSNGETLLYEKASPYNNVVVTQNAEGMRILRFEHGGARQSLVKPGDPDYLGLPYAKTAFTGLALTGEPKRILVIGLGGGTLPSFLHKHYPAAVIDAVDIDPVVVDVARRYFGFRDDALMKGHVGDGRRFVEDVKQPYDMIFLDAYGSDSVPEHLATEEFLRAVRRAVRPDGIVVGNIWGRGHNRLYDTMVRTYQEVFDDLYILDVRNAGNQILLALPRSQPLTQEQLAQLARRVSTAKRFDFDLGEQVNYGFEHMQVKNPKDRVLRDRDLARNKPAPVTAP